MANLWSTYDFSIDHIKGFRLGGGLNYQGRTYSDITNVNSIPGYVIGNAMMGYEKENYGVDFTIDNITDRRYFLAANVAGAYVSQPLTAFVNLHVNY